MFQQKLQAVISALGKIIPPYFPACHAQAIYILYRICQLDNREIFHESCFGPVINPALLTGVPIDAVLTPIPPINVRAFIPFGTTTVRFDLSDFGVIAGNTDLFLVATASATKAQPPTVSNAFDAAMDLVSGQLRPAIVDAFQRAFEEQVSTPVLRGLQKAHADPGMIAKVTQQLAQASAEQASVSASTIASLLNGETLLTQLQRNLGKLFSGPAAPPTSITKFVANVGSPNMKINQSINDILTFGFNPEKVEYSWKNISAKTVFKQDVQPKPVFAEATVKPDVKTEEPDPATGEGAKVKATLTASLTFRPTQDTTLEIEVEAIGASFSSQGVSGPEPTVTVGVTLRF